MGMSAPSLLASTSQLIPCRPSVHLIIIHSWLLVLPTVLVPRPIPSGQPEEVAQWSVPCVYSEDTHKFMLYSAFFLAQDIPVGLQPQHWCIQNARTFSTTGMTLVLCFIPIAHLIWIRKHRTARLAFVLRSSKPRNQSILKHIPSAPVHGLRLLECIVLRGTAETDLPLRDC